MMRFHSEGWVTLKNKYDFKYLIFLVLAYIVDFKEYFVFLTCTNERFLFIGIFIEQLQKGLGSTDATVLR